MVGANRFIFWNKKRPTLAFNWGLTLKFEREDKISATTCIRNSRTGIKRRWWPSPNNQLLINSNQWLHMILVEELTRNIPQGIQCTYNFNSLSTNHWPARYLFQLSRRDRDFYLPIMWFEIEIEIFTSLSCGSRSRFSRSRFFIIESHVSRRDRDFSSLNLVVRDEIENFHHWILKFETRSRCFSFLSSTNFKPQSREQRMIFP